MAKLCPIINDECKMENCMAWKEDSCVLFSYFENERYIPEAEEGEEIEVPPAIKNSTPEELTNELVNLAKTETPINEFDIEDVVTKFWKNKGIDNILENMSNLPFEIRQKIEKINLTVYPIIKDEVIKKQDEAFEKESERLPQVVDSCCQWAKEHGIRTLRLGDVETFIREKKIHFDPRSRPHEITRMIWNMTNLKLRSKS